MTTIDADKKIELLMKVWEKVQDKQIHFDDMIMQTRAITLSVVVASFAAIVAVSRIAGGFSLSTTLIFASIPACFWISAMLIDQLYYYRLLIGAVQTGDKLQDELEKAGITFEDVNQDLTAAIHPTAARAVILAYYLLPLVLAIFIIACAS